MKPSAVDRVLLDATLTTDEPSGVRTRLLGLLPAYTNHNRSVELVVLADRGSDIATRLDRLGVEVIETCALSLPERWLARASWIERHAHACGAGAVQLENVPVPPRRVIPYLYSLHDVRLFEVGERRSTAQRLKRRSICRSSQRASVVLALTEAAARRIHTMVGVDKARLRVVGCGLEVREGDPAALPVPLRGRAYVLVLGHLEHRKRPDVALAASIAAGTPHDLVFAGADLGSEPLLRKLTADAGAGHVHFLGTVDEEVKWALLAHANAVLVPSAVEGFGITALEAMSLGRPVATSSIPELVEVTGDGAVHIDLGDLSSWSRFIDAVLRDDAFAANLGRSGVESALRHTWARAARQLEIAYEAAMDPPQQ